MPAATCENHVGYDGEKWGARLCGKPINDKCSYCKKNVCERHLSAGKKNRMCMDCFQKNRKTTKETE